MPRTLRWLIATLLAAGPAADALAQITVQRPVSDLAQATLEELLDIRVTSAGRKEQRRDEVAAAIFVLTDDDIRRSGITTLPEVFRLVPGMQVARVSAIDRDDVMRYVGGDEELFVEVIRLFLEDCPARLSGIKAAVERGDAEAIRQTAHALKGAAGNLSAAGLCEAARTLERIGADGRIDAAAAAWRRLAAEAASVLDALRRFEGRPSKESPTCAH
jgi:HPt (histidine-containing phosphotransfer) domain-containing protein